LSRFSLAWLSCRADDAAAQAQQDRRGNAHAIAIDSRLEIAF
jgi:hypothetical protein